MRFDKTINVGQLLTIISMVVTLALGWSGMQAQVREIINILGRVERIVDRHTEQIADHEKQINLWRGERDR